MIPPKWPDIALLAGNDTLQLNSDQSKLTEFNTENAISFIKKKYKNENGIIQRTLNIIVQTYFF